MRGMVGRLMWLRLHIAGQKMRGVVERTEEQHIRELDGFCVRDA